MVPAPKAPQARGSGDMAVDRLRLQPGEQVVVDMLPSAFWTMGKYIITLGLWAVWRSKHHFVLTNQRVHAYKGIVSKDEKLVPLAGIQDVSLSRSVLRGGYVALSSAGGALSIQRIGPLTRENARVFADAITERIQQGGDGLGAPSAPPPPSGLSGLPPMPPGTPAQWAADPSRQSGLRYWDGQRWTEHVSAGAEEPAAAAPPPPPPPPTAS